MNSSVWRRFSAPLMRGVVSACVALQFSACQGSHEGDVNQSPMAVAEWTLGNALSADPVAPERLGPYLSEKAKGQLIEIQTHTQPDESLGVLTLNLSQGNHWAGRYGFLKGEWPLALHFELHKQNQFWSIKEFPFAKVYKQLIQLVGPNGLPRVQSGEPWTGGLISFDRSGRPLGEVVLTWLPPYAFIDGIPLYGKATAEKIIEEVAIAFSKREEMAAQAQANYFRRIAIAMNGSSRLEELMKVISWVEDAGAVSISMLAQSEDGEARLLRLAQRTSTLSHGAPQRVLKGQVATGGSFTLTLLDLTQKSVQKPSSVLIDMSTNSDRSLARSKVLGLYQQATSGRLEGAIITPQGSSTLQELAHVLDAFKSIDPDLSVAVTPYQAQSQGSGEGK